MVFYNPSKIMGVKMWQATLNILYFSGHSWLTTTTMLKKGGEGKVHFNCCSETTPIFSPPSKRGVHLH